MDNYKDEKWVEIKGYEGFYQISDFGRVKSIGRETYNKYGKLSNRLKDKIMSPNEVNGGYLQVSLRLEGKRKAFKIHRLVAEHFLKNEMNKKEVNHMDRDVKNNKVSNLEWVTPAENMKHLEDNFGFNFGRKSVSVYDIDLKFIKRFKSVSEASIWAGSKLRENGKPINGNVVRSLKTEGRLTAYGFRFKYDNEICTD